MSRFHQTSKFGGGDQRDVFSSPSTDDEGFLMVDDLVQYRGEILAEGRIGRTEWHVNLEWRTAADFDGARAALSDGDDAILEADVLDALPIGRSCR